MLINNLCKISHLHCNIWKSHRRTQLSSFSWNIRASLGLNCLMTMTGWIWAGSTSIWPGQALLTLSEIHHCHWPTLSYTYELEAPALQNYFPLFYHVENTLNILWHTFCDLSSGFLKKSCYFPNKGCETSTSPSIHNWLKLEKYNTVIQSLHFFLHFKKSQTQAS